MIRRCSRAWPYPACRSASWAAGASRHCLMRIQGLNCCDAARSQRMSSSTRWIAFITTRRRTGLSHSAALCLRRWPAGCRSWRRQTRDMRRGSARARTDFCFTAPPRPRHRLQPCGMTRHCARASEPRRGRRLRGCMTSHSASPCGISISAQQAPPRKRPRPDISPCRCPTAAPPSPPAHCAEP